jgi:hypothetical protein
MANLTLEDIEKTPLGRQIIAERDAQAQAEREAAEAKRQADVTGWAEELASLTEPYEALREEALTALGLLAEYAERLLELRTRCRTLLSYLRAAGGQAEGYSAPLDPTTARKRFLEPLRRVQSSLGGGI